MDVFSICTAFEQRIFEPGFRVAFPESLRIWIISAKNRRRGSSLLPLLDYLHAGVMIECFNISLHSTDAVTASFHLLLILVIVFNDSIQFCKNLALPLREVAVDVQCAGVMG